jgi:hypothetical protein
MFIASGNQVGAKQDDAVIYGFYRKTQVQPALGRKKVGHPYTYC